MIHTGCINGYIGSTCQVDYGRASKMQVKIPMAPFTLRLPLLWLHRSLFLKLGGEEVEYDPGFQLYLQTKLSNPHYKPEIAAQVQYLYLLCRTPWL